MVYFCALLQKLLKGSFIKVLKSYRLECIIDFVAVFVLKVGLIRIIFKKIITYGDPVKMSVAPLVIEKGSDNSACVFDRGKPFLDLLQSEPLVLISS